jgi:cytochrome c oxidase subunit IV
MTYKAYWGTWLALLIVTLAMIAAGSGTLVGGVLLAVLLLGMTVKIGLIGGNFMHLRSENRVLILIVALGILLVGIALFAGIAVDAARVARLAG